MHEEMVLHILKSSKYMLLRLKCLSLNDEKLECVLNPFDFTYSIHPSRFSFLMLLRKHFFFKFHNVYQHLERRLFGA